MPEIKNEQEILRDVSIMQAIDHRNTEIAEYDLHINCLESILDQYKNLPDEWPGEIKQFKGKKSTFIAENVEDKDLELVMKLHHRDITKADLRMAHIERHKSMSRQIGMAMQITPEREIIARAKIAENEQIKMLSK